MSSQKKIGLTMATIVGMNAMIGAGIFVVPSALQALVGPAGLLSYAFVIVAVWFMALSIARVAQLYPQEGAFYVYAAQWGGHAMGLISAVSYLIGLTIALGLLARVTGNYLNIYFPDYSVEFLGLAVVSLLVLLNLAGAKLTHIGQIILIVFTLLPLALITMLCLSKASLTNLTPFAPYGFANILTATQAVIFGFFGFEAIPSLFTLVEKPEKNVPRAITYSIILVGLIYLTFVASIILALPRELFTSASMPLSQVLIQMFPQYPWLVQGIHIAIIITIAGTIHSMIWSLSNLMLSCLKKTKTLKHALTQSSAVLVIGFGIAVACLTLKNLDLLFSLTALFIVFTYASAIVVLLIKPENRSRYNVIIASCGLITAAIILVCALDMIRLFF